MIRPPLPLVLVPVLLPLVLLPLVLLPLVLVSAALPARAQDRVVNIYNWTDYIDPAVLDQFTKETGIKTRYDVFDSLETLEAKLLAGHSGYDVVVPSNEPTFSRLIKAGALAEIDRPKVPNWKNLDPAMMRQVESSDPGNRHGAIYLWGSIGLGINSDRIKALAPDAPLDSWSLLFDPHWAKALAPCGIVMMDSAIDVVPSVLHYLGRNPSSGDPADFAAAEKTLMAIRPYIRTFASGGALELLANGDACLVFDYSGDVAQAATRAAEANKGVRVEYVVPREGAEIGFDMLAMPADAPHKPEALAFIDFVLRPEIMARITNLTRYPNAIPATRALVDPALLSDPRVFPPPDVAARFFTITQSGPAADRARTRMWARFKAGG
ncbi:extracellular solute-binding protein [Rhodopila sp.]|jgi:putrescine transport system substrate-binding protein|uniref:extracellular solute-binding protein n=1 Tax=Rhodopila sp. TaxID=2480087 RepID=UPI002CE2C0AE|nr:extracellular solute-binding protein [Rhodopila sp.]HVZ08947.1 extracellular solute-binding protein [Rhodopila sp.]